MLICSPCNVRHPMAAKGCLAQSCYCCRASGVHSRSPGELNCGEGKSKQTHIVQSTLVLTEALLMM